MGRRCASESGGWRSLSGLGGPQLFESNQLELLDSPRSLKLQESTDTIILVTESTLDVRMARHLSYNYGLLKSTYLRVEYCVREPEKDLTLPDVACLIRRWNCGEIVERRCRTIVQFGNGQTTVVGQDRRKISQVNEVGNLSDFGKTRCLVNDLFNFRYSMKDLANIGPEDRRISRSPRT